MVVYEIFLVFSIRFQKKTYLSSLKNMILTKRKKNELKIILLERFESFDLMGRIAGIDFDEGIFLLNMSTILLISFVFFNVVFIDQEDQCNGCCEHDGLDPRERQ